MQMHFEKKKKIKFKLQNKKSNTKFKIKRKKKEMAVAINSQQCTYNEITEHRIEQFSITVQSNTKRSDCKEEA